MAGRDTDSGSEPSLELPSFGRRRRKRRAAEGGRPPEAAAPAADAAAPVPRSPAPESGDDAPTAGAAPVTREMPRAESPPTVDGGAPPAAATPPPPARRRRRTLPSVAGPVAAAATGGLVGLVAVGATFAALQGCEAVRGTASCGDGPGFLLLLAVLVLLTWVGSLALRALGVDDPGSTSILAVGLLAVVALLFLADVLASPWMALVLPLVGAATFALSHQVTTTVVEDDGA